MSNHDTWLSRDDIQDIDQRRSGVLHAASASREECGAIYDRIGEILLSNITRLRLDEGLMQILAVANRTAAELLSPRIGKLHYPEGIWARGMTGVLPPFRRTSEPAENTPWEMTPAKRAIAMTHVLAQVVQLDPLLRDGGRALLKYERDRNLMPPEESIDDIDG